MARKQLQTLTEPMYYTLLCLTEKRHGYGIMKQVKIITNGRLTIGAGTMYSLLSRFEKEYIIRMASNLGGKKTYILTLIGREILEKEMSRLKSLIRDGELYYDKI